MVKAMEFWSMRFFKQSIQTGVVFWFVFPNYINRDNKQKILIQSEYNIEYHSFRIWQITNNSNWEGTRFLWQ